MKKKKKKGSIKGTSQINETHKAHKK